MRLLLINALRLGHKGPEKISGCMDDYGCTSVLSVHDMRHLYVSRMPCLCFLHPTNPFRSPFAYPPTTYTLSHKGTCFLDI